VQPAPPLRDPWLIPALAVFGISVLMGVWVAWWAQQPEAPLPLTEQVEVLRAGRPASKP
jgi:hypothetical protein